MSGTASRKRTRKTAPSAPRTGSPPIAARSLRFSWILLVLIVVFAGVVRLRLLQIPLERDEGEYAYAGQLLLQGIPPYKLVWNMKVPGTYGAYAAIMALFGQSIGGIHLGFLLVNAATIVLIFFLGRRLFNASAGVAAGAAYALLSVSAGVMGTQAHATHFVAIAAVGGMLALLRGVDPGRWLPLFLAGALFGLATLMKQHGVLFVVFAAAYLMWSSWPRKAAAWGPLLRKLAWLFAGVCLPLAATGFALWRAGVFDRFWFWTFTYARQYALENSIPDGLAAFADTFPRVVGPNLLIWLVAALGLAVVWRRKEHRAAAVFVAGLLAFSVLAICPGFYFREHYFVLLLPPVALLAGAAAGLDGTWRRWGFAAVLAFSILLQGDFLFRMSPLEASRFMYGDSPFPPAVPVADYIRAHSSPASRIAVLGSEPEVPFYARRRSATGYIYMYALMEPQPYALGMQNELIRDVETSRPEYVVWLNIATSWLRRADSPSRVFDWWESYRPRHYALAGVAEILSNGRTEYHWDVDDSWQPQSPNLIAVYKRIGSASRNRAAAQ